VESAKPTRPEWRLSLEGSFDKIIGKAKKEAAM